MSQPEGKRADAGKLRMDLVPADVVEEMARVLTFGAAKYAPRNWERGMSWSRTYASLLRHLSAWAQGERRDPESGLRTMAHVLCNAAFLLAWELRGMEQHDDVESELRAQRRSRPVGVADVVDIQARLSPKKPCEHCGNGGQHWLAHPERHDEWLCRSCLDKDLKRQAGDKS